MKDKLQKILKSLNKTCIELGFELNPYTKQEYLKKYGERSIVISPGTTSISNISLTNEASVIGKIQNDYDEVKEEISNLKSQIKKTNGNTRKAHINEKEKLIVNRKHANHIIKKHQACLEALDNTLKAFSFIKRTTGYDNSIKWFRTAGINRVLVITLQVR